MVKTSSILGLNARAQLFSYPFNPPHGKKIADSKLLTKKYLKQVGIPTPDVYAKFREPRELLAFDWESLPSSFALKPSKSLGGEGIIVAKKKEKDTGKWITTQRRKVGIEDLKLHVLDILEGAFSLGNVPDVAFFEEYVGRHKAFRKYAYRGTPDIRIIVFNKVPVMAMLRLPTKESGGRANLYQGAIAVGIDIATGITTRANWHGKQIVYKPGTKRKLRGIKIPRWDEILDTSVRCQETAELGYLGVDIVLHPEKGPMVLEINAQPGLKIQLANMAGLRKRLDRIEGLTVKSPEHGVKIAKALFASAFADRVKVEKGIMTVGTVEEIKIKSASGKKVKVAAKIDTGAWRTSIDRSLADELGLLKSDNVLWYKRVRSALGKERRPVIDLVFWIKGRKVETNATTSNRSRLKHKVLIGRKALKGFLVSPDNHVT